MFQPVDPAPGERTFFRHGTPSVADFATWLTALGDGAILEVRLRPGESAHLLKRRLTRAARATGRALDYARRPDGSILARVRTPRPDARDAPAPRASRTAATTGA